MSDYQSAATVLIADDHPLMLRALEGLFEGQPDLRLVGACSNGITALDEIRRLRPEIALVDVNMPGLNGLRVAQSARAEQLPTRVMLLTAELDDADIFDAVTSGVDGIVFKDASPSDLVEIVLRVRSGEKWFPAEIIDDAVLRQTERHAKKEAAWSCLSLREREIAYLVAEGLHNKEIAYRLGITEGTVKLHVSKIYSKSNIHDRKGLASLFYSMDCNPKRLGRR